MRKMLLKIKKLLDKILEVGLGIAMICITLVVLWQVFTRFVIQSPSSWTEEMAIFLLIWIGLLGSAVALKYKAHLGIDVLVGSFPPRYRHLTAVFVYACVILFSVCVLVFGGSRVVALVLLNEQISPALHIRMGYVYLALPISGAFMTIYAVEFLITEIKRFITVSAAGGEEPEEKAPKLDVMYE